MGRQTSSASSTQRGTTSSSSQNPTRRNRRTSGRGSDVRGTMRERASSHRALQMTGEVIETTDPDMYQVEDIYAYEERNGEDYYRVKWEGYPNQDTWEPASNLLVHREFAFGHVMRRLKETFQAKKKGRSLTTHAASSSPTEIVVPTSSSSNSQSPNPRGTVSPVLANQRNDPSFSSPSSPSPPPSDAEKQRTRVVQELEDDDDEEEEEEEEPEEDGDSSFIDGDSQSGHSVSSSSSFASSSSVASFLVGNSQSSSLTREDRRVVQKRCRKTHAVNAKSSGARHTSKKKQRRTGRSTFAKRAVSSSVSKASKGRPTKEVRLRARGRLRREASLRYESESPSRLGEAGTHAPLALVVLPSSNVGEEGPSASSSALPSAGAASEAECGGCLGSDGFHVFEMNAEPSVEELLCPASSETAAPKACLVGQALANPVFYQEGCLSMEAGRLLARSVSDLSTPLNAFGTLPLADTQLTERRVEVQAPSSDLARLLFEIPQRAGDSTCPAVQSEKEGLEQTEGLSGLDWVEATATVGEIFQPGWSVSPVAEATTETPLSPSLRLSYAAQQQTPIFEDPADAPLSFCRLADSQVLMEGPPHSLSAEEPVFSASTSGGEEGSVSLPVLRLELQIRRPVEGATLAEQRRAERSESNGEDQGRVSVLPCEKIFPGRIRVCSLARRVRSSDAAAEDGKFDSSAVDAEGLEVLFALQNGVCVKPAVTTEEQEQRQSREQVECFGRCSVREARRFCPKALLDFFLKATRFVCDEGRCLSADRKSVDDGDSSSKSTSSTAAFSPSGPVGGTPPPSEEQPPSREFSKANADDASSAPVS